jgi:hypothetical protein
MMAGGPMMKPEDELKLREQQMMQQAQRNQYFDPRDFPTPGDYQRALQDAQRSADLAAGQQNMRQGIAMKATQIRAQMEAQKQAMQRGFMARQRDLGRQYENPQEVVPPRAATFFVPDIVRALGPKLWRKEIAGIAHAKLHGEKLDRATLGVCVIPDRAEANVDVRPYINAALAGLTQLVNSVERMSISVERFADVPGPGMQLHLVEVSRKAANVLSTCEFEQRLGSMYCLTHRQNAVACMQAQRDAGTLDMSLAQAIQNVEPQQSPFLVLGKKMFGDFAS